VILSRTRKHVPVLLSRNEAVPNAGSSFAEKPDGSLGFLLGSRNLTVQIVGLI
jgi:hypothetical protein